MAYYLSGSLTAGIWAHKGGVWHKMADHPVYIFQSVGGGGQQTVGWGDTLDVNLGPGVDYFGLTLVGHDGVSAAVTDIAAVAWSAVTTSGERSATPNGQLSTVVINPT